MRLVPLIPIVVLANASALGDDYHVYAGQNHGARKLNNDGLTYEIKGDFVNARRCFDEAVHVDPTMWPAYVNRASLDIQEHKFHQAVDDATMALRVKSSFNRSAILRADANIKLGNYDSALRDINQLLSLGEKGDAYAHALNASAWLRATCPNSRFRNGQLAITEAKKACGLTNYQKPEVLDTLAAAYAETGDFENALRFEEKALSIRDTPAMVQHYRKHLSAYKQHRPWRDTVTN